MTLPLGRLLAFAGRGPEGLGVSGGQLSPCPDSPNCVCSDAEDPAHAIAPLSVKGDPGEAWASIRSSVAALPGARVVDEGPDYLRAECTTRLLGFIDDLELHLRPERGEIAVRSASRLGYSDLGANRRRVEELRARLRQRG